MDKTIIAVCGMSGTGKSCAKEYLAKKLKCPKIEVSDIVDKYSKNKGLDLIGSSLLAHKLYDKIKNCKKKIIIVGGIREVSLLYGIEFNKNRVISIAIRCGDATRNKRLLERGMTQAQIDEKTKNEIKIGTREVVKKCGYTVTNNQDKTTLYKILDEILTIERLI